MNLLALVVGAPVGALDPQGAFEAARTRPEPLRWAALEGMAGMDPGAALDWARKSLPTPVLQSALLEIAAAIGGKDPLAALALVEEVGWGEVGKFYQITTVEGGNKGSSET